MRKKILSLFLALATSVGLSWATVITWDASKVSSMAMNVSSGSDSRTSDGITVTAVSTGEFVVFGDHGGAIEIGNGEGSGGGYLTFTSSVGNIAQIDIYHSGAGEWRNANGDWISPYYENFEGGIFTWSGTPAASITLTGDAPRHIDDITSIEFTIENGGGSTPTPTEPVTVVFEANNNQKEVEVTLPHTFACDFENGQGELDGIIQELYALQYGGYCQAFNAPTATGNEAVTASKDGNNHYIAISEAFEGTATVTGNYIKYLDTEHMGNTSVDYTLTISVQGSTPTPTPSATGGIFANCYDCWRSPEYPNISGQCHLFNFGNPGVGNKNPSGPWKLEFVEYYNSSSTEYDDIVSSYAASQYGKSPEQMEVYRLYQWQNGAYQPVAYGVLYAYANESNPVEHAAFFEANGYWGCYLTGNTHSEGDDFNILFDEDASTGFADLHGGSTPAVDPTPTPSGDGDKLAGAFSVSGTKVVYFSKGNLQATTNDLGATWTWGFAENQWDYVGDNAANTSFEYWGETGNGSYDLFGWIGESSTLDDYRKYGIGSNYDFTDCGNTAGEDLKADWGSLMGSDWRTLTYDEWQYLIKSRNNAANLLAYATVNGKTGLILLPDSWTSSSVALTITTTNYTTNIISASDWSTLEEQGCVFLPAAGSREDASVSGVGVGGDYWSSSSPSGKQYDEGNAYCFFFDTDFSKQADGMHFNKRGRGYGLSVRLVSETAPSPAPAPAGLQVTELEIPDSWQNDQTLVTISDLPGFVAVSLEEAGAWDAVPAGDVVLIYAGTNEGVTATYFHNGAWGDPVPFGGFSRADIFEWASGSKIFYTSGGSTPAVDPAVQNVIDLINAIPNPVAYNDECKDAIDAARAAYDALDADQKVLVSNYSTLTDAEDAYAALIPVVTNYSISLDGITENADKVTLNNASAAEGETITLTPAAGYQITAFTASYASAYSVRVTADPNVDVYEATPYVGALPKEFTENVTPGLNGATFHSIEGDDPFTPVPASVLEYVGMNAAKDQMTIRVNDAFSGIIRVNYTYNVETCEWDDYSQQEICMGGTAQASVRVVCEAAGGVAPASKDDVTGAYSFTMPAGNVTITATVEPVTPAVDPAVQNVIDLINAIPNPVAYNDECKDAIDAARAAYDALDADQKALVSNYSTLTDAEAAYAALIPVVTNYSISLDGITENADKVTISAASAEEGATVTLTPAEGYQITAFTASYASAYSVRVTADPSVDVYEATPYVGALPKEFTENVTPGLNGATFHSIEGDDPFTPVPASVLEYVGMNAAKDQMTIRVNDAFSGIIRVNYTYNVETCEWDEYEQQEICMGGTAVASVRVVCEAAGGVAPASKDAVTGAYSFTMPAGNVTITATVEAIPAPAPTAAVIGDPNNASEVATFLTTYDGQTIDELIIDRPVLNNMYNTLCLPFDMNATQIAASSLNGVEIREFTGASVEGTTLNLSVGDPVNAVVAGRPYFVKYSAASQLDDLHFEDVTINNALLDNMAVTFDGVTFKGTFTPFVMPNGLNFNGGYLFLGQNNQLFWPNTSNPLKPFRAYFYVDVESSTPGNAPKYRGMPARIVEGKNVATGVENANLKSEINNQKFIKDGQLIIIRNGVEYNVNGQIVK